MLSVKQLINLKKQLGNTTYKYELGNPNFVPLNEHNVFFINRTRSVFEERLAFRGFVFLNEILNALDIPPTVVGQFAGWTEGPIDLNIKETRYLGPSLTGYTLEIKHQGIILFDVLED